MELLTLIFFVLTLLIAALLVTQIIRRDLKARERLKFQRLEVERNRLAARRHSVQARPIANAHAPGSMHARTLQGRARGSHT
jgi:hypothetical protein